MADQDDRLTAFGEPAGLEVHLRDERARRVEDREVAPLGVRVDLGRDAVRRQDHHGALRHLGLLVDEDRPLGLEVANDVEVVDDLLADVYGLTVGLEGPLDRLDGALDAGAVAARGRQQDLGGHDPIVPALAGLTPGHRFVGPYC